MVTGIVAGPTVRDVAAVFGARQIGQFRLAQTGAITAFPTIAAVGSGSGRDRMIAHPKEWVRGSGMLPAPSDVSTDLFSYFAAFQAIRTITPRMKHIGPDLADFVGSGNEPSRRCRFVR